MDTLKQTWELDSIFPDGSQSAALRQMLAALKQDISELDDCLCRENCKSAENLKDILQRVETISAKLVECAAFVGCLLAQNVKDSQAKVLMGEIMQLRAALSNVDTQFDQLLVSIPDQQWQALLQEEWLKPIAFPVNEKRELAAKKMEAEKEALAAELAVDGYNAWSQMYDTIIGNLSVTIMEDGQEKTFSIGQALNLLSEPDRKVRAEAFAQLKRVWQEQEEVLAATLNHLAGFRLSLYRNRGWDDVLAEPLAVNRMSAKTLDAMWAAVNAGKPKLVKYMEQKAKLLGIDKLAWYDLEAPLGAAGKKMSYDEAATYIIDKFAHFSSELADFAQHAFTQRWIEAEDRPFKQPGGFCTTFPLSKQSRIFSTYSGTIQGVATLAHELGHAYHSFVTRDLPFFLQDYPMNVAETASTFGELLVVDAAIKNASSLEEKLALLDDKLQRGVAFFMDIHCRFLFETRFYQARKQGLLTAQDFNRIMLEAQQEAFCDSLSEYHPYFWAAKLHFYITDVPFYNFPYTFGYLFSMGIYARALKEGSDFAQRYRQLLQDTGRMTVEDLAQKHLGVDLTQPAFWEEAVSLVLRDIDEFLALCDKVRF